MYKNVIHIKFNITEVVFHDYNVYKYIIVI